MATHHKTTSSCSFASNTLSNQTNISNQSNTSSPSTSPPPSPPDKKKSILLDRCKLKQKELERLQSPTRSRTTVKSHPPVKTQPKSSEEFLHIFVTFGANGDLARKTTYPTLWNLFKNNLLPSNIHFYGFAKTSMTLDELREKNSDFMSVEDGEEKKLDEFWKLNHYYVGNYSSRVDYELFNKELNNYEWTHNSSNRIYYIALPNAMIETVTQNLKAICGSTRNGWTRVIVEKPFGKDESSSEKLTQHLLTLFKEDEIYRIDQYLGKGTIQHLTTLRFSNLLFSSTWNRRFIQCVMITIKEEFGIQDKGKTFDGFGIIRDVMLPHLLSLLSIVAMEKPISVTEDYIRDEKVKVLKCIDPVKIDDVVLGQYAGVPVGNDGFQAKTGYLEEIDVPNTSITPTFCIAVLKINNERWDGVPFILKCGKALDERKVEICLQYQDVPGDLFFGKSKRNEIIIQAEPNERVYIKAMAQTNDFVDFNIEETELPLNLNNNNNGTNNDSNHKTTDNHFNRDSYERLILNVFNGVKMHFIRSDELTQAWRIFTPLLNKIDNENIRPFKYIHGTDGPLEAQRLIKKYKFVQKE